MSKRRGPESTEAGHVDRGKVCSSIRPEKDFNALWEGKESIVVGCVFVCCMYMGILESTPMCTQEDQEKLLKVFL